MERIKELQEEIVNLFQLLQIIIHKQKSLNFLK